MNKRGQALIEFVLILPIFLFLILAMYDFGMIFTRQNKLETDSNDIVLMYKSGKTVDEISNIYKPIVVMNKIDSEYTEITVSDKLKLVTPGFNLIFGNPYEITVKRYIYNEQ